MGGAVNNGSIQDPYNRARALADEVKQLKQKLDQVYSERNCAAILAAKLALKCGLSAGKGLDKKDGWQHGWCHVIYIQLSEETQVSWHMSPSEVALLSDIPSFPGSWNNTFLSRGSSYLKAVETEDLECVS